MTKSELIEKYAVTILVDGCSVQSISELLTRLLEAYDAQRGVEGWHERVAKEWLDPNGELKDDALVPGLVESLAALIAQHAPRGVDVDAVWDAISTYMCKKAGDPPCIIMQAVMITKPELAAALLAAQGER